MSDISIKTDRGFFNLRAAAVILRNDKLLAVKDGSFAFWYLPGGRVHTHESTEDAVRRECLEELGVEAVVKRLLWVAESFWQEQEIRYHELCFYYLIETPVLPETFTRVEDDGFSHEFRWFSYHELYAAPVYPTFLSDKLKHLSNTVEHITMDEGKMPDGSFL